MKKKPILITGSHRSGSTWIGKIICCSPEVRYIHEPFNIQIELHNSPFKYWFQHISDSTNKDFQVEVLTYLKNFCHFSFSLLFRKIMKSKSIKKKYKSSIEEFSKIRKRTLIKDPIAIMAAEWLNHNLDCDIIISIRHPAAFIASIKVKKWEFDFNNYLEQEELMRGYLNEYKDQIIEYAKHKKDIVRQGILLWNTIYATVLQYKEKYNDDWYFVKHENLSRDPIEEYRKIFNFLNLKFSDTVKNNILNSSTMKNESELNRDSIKNIFTWKDRLSLEEIVLIKEQTRDVWKAFYTEEDWNY